MPRALNICSVDDDDDNYDMDSVLTDQNETAPSGNSICPSAKMEGVRDAHTYPTSKTERHNKKQHRLFLQICHNNNKRHSHHHHKEDTDAEAAAEADAATALDDDADLLRFGVGTYGETEQEMQRERGRQKEPRYGRKQLAVPTLRRRESVYDRLRRSSSFAQQSEDGPRNLTNERVAQRSARRTDERQRSVQQEAAPAAEEARTTPTLPPIVATREEKGGVMDAYGYFSTHRVNPYYYRELDQQQQHPSTTTSHTNYGGYKNSISSNEAAAADGSRKSSKSSHRRSFLGGKVDAATAAADSEHRLYATKRYDEERGGKTVDHKPYNNVYRADRRTDTRKESLYGQRGPAVKAA